MIAAAVVAPLLAACVGCQALAMPFIMFGEEPTKPVAAEYPHLEGRKVAILVWADNDTLFEFRNVQLELSEYVGSVLKANVKRISLVPSRTVVDYQRSDADWDRRPPAEVGKQLDAERVLLIELTQYTTREPTSPHLYRGRISANVKVYDTALADSAPTFRTTVETVYPPGAAAEWGSSDTSVRDAAMRTFAADVSNKFHDRRVKVK
ncbi:MAG: hypothetical protein HZB38_08850 [Planctomycetes bacterium]|nr:hypothetical protein [Planctomycetota bacterium]